MIFIINICRHIFGTLYICTLLIFTSTFVNDIVLQQFSVQIRQNIFVTYISMNKNHWISSVNLRGLAT